MAPVSPFFADALFRNLNAVTGRNAAVSVHHARFPEADPGAIDTDLEERMGLAQDACSLMLSIRKKVNIRVRQPLQKALIPILDADMRRRLGLVEDLIKAEVNIKEIEYISGDNDFIRKRVKPNFVILGKKLGARMKAVSGLLAQLTQEEIRSLEASGHIHLSVDGEDVEILVSEVDIQSEDVPGWIVASKGGLTVALDIQVSEELELEGNARELVNRIQKIRKDSGFELTDRIQVKLSDVDKLTSTITRYKDYICAEILADGLEVDANLSEGTEVEVNEIPLKIQVIKKG
jgi:isoleucyl-tRNA synthetase